jgi:hypothetical protein
MGVTNMNSLALLNVYMNLLEGKLEEAFVNASSLQVVDLSVNSFSGGLPWSLFRVDGLGRATVLLYTKGFSERCRVV